MSRPRDIRCSSLPMLFACARSQDESELLIEAFNGAADLGTATHDGMTQVVSGSGVDVELLALRHGVDKEELGPLVWYGRQAWEELRDAFPLPETEVEVSCLSSGYRITGHIDLLSIVGDEARFLDWKSGRKEESDYYAQLCGYAMCILRSTRCRRVTGSVVWLRSQTLETFAFTRGDADAFEERVHARLAANARYSHGAHCAYCPRSHDCEALVAISRRDVAIFGAKDMSHTAVSGVQQATPQEVVSYRRRMKLLEVFGASLEEAIRRRVAAEGPLASGDGYELALIEEPGKRELDTAKAWPVLQERLTDEEMAACVTVSAKDADAAVAKKAGKGHGAAAKRELRAALEAAGALTQPSILKLKEVRLPEEKK